MFIRRFLFPFALSILSSLAFSFSANASDTANSVTVTCRGSDLPTGITATMTDWNTLQRLKALCDDQGGSGTIEVLQIISFDVQPSPEIERIYRSAYSEWVARTELIPCVEPGCDFDFIEITTYELVEYDDSVVIRVLVCPVEYNYRYYIDGDLIGQTVLGGGACVWRTRTG